MRWFVNLKALKFALIGSFALGLTAGFYTANNQLTVIAPVAAQSDQDEPMVSPVEPWAWGFYAANSEQRAPARQFWYAQARSFFKTYLIKY